MSAPYIDVLKAVATEPTFYVWAALIALGLWAGREKAGRP